jgi:AAA ATPase domain
MSESLENKLIQCLSKIPGMERRETRNLLLQDLPENPVSLIERHDSHRQDLSSIVRAVIKFKKINDTRRFAVEILVSNAQRLVEGLEKYWELDSIAREFCNRNEFKNQKNEKCNLPPKRDGNHFVGRQEEIQELLNCICPDLRQHMTVLKGIGGVGKTSLAVEVAYQCWYGTKEVNNNIPKFEAIIFSSSKATDLVDLKLLERPEKEPTLLEIFRVIAETLDEPSITQVEFEKQQEQVRKALRRQATLLIIDNMETLEDTQRDGILAFLNNVPYPTQVIITTREHPGFGSITIDKLTKEESLSLISTQAKIKRISITENQKNEIYDRFSGIPIAMIYAIGQKAAGHRFKDILRPTRLLPGDPQNSCILPEDLGKFCFEGSVTPLRGTAAHQLLMSIAFFREPPCHEALIKVSGLTKETREVKDGLAKLQQLSLVSGNEKRYSILPITREYIMSELETHTDSEFKAMVQDRWIEWYLKFTKEYGGLDWADWRSRYDRLDEEWGNIESVLYFCSANANWTKVMELWQNIDNYVDLTRYWQKRRHWWKLLEVKVGITDLQLRGKALAERAWTLILMGIENHQDAERCLDEAWDLRSSLDVATKLNIANYSAILAKSIPNPDFASAKNWLGIEAELLNSCDLTEKECTRYRIRNLYYLAEINNLEANISEAKQQYEEAIRLGESVKWQRFINYSQNSLAEIFIQEDELQKAENLLKGGLLVAEGMRETRRIALYHKSYAHLSYKLFQKANQSQSQNKQTKEYLKEAKEYGEKALKVFEKEWMKIEQEQIYKLLELIQENLGNLENTD